MTTALPALVHEIDPKRVAATAATIAVHLLALMLLLAPVEWTPPQFTEEAVITVEDWKKPIIPPPPPPPPVREVVRRPDAVRPQPTQPVEFPPVIHETQGAMDYVAPDVTETETVDSFEIGPPAGPVTLAILEGPAPRYPGRAIQMGITGKVILRIEVDAEGRPTSGRIETSSGSSLLDRAALDTVLKKWRFVPAQQNGQPVAATALVPIIFALD